MHTISQVAHYFCLSLGFGVYFFQFLAHPQNTGGGLLRVLASIGLGGIILAGSLDYWLYAFSMRLGFYLLALGLFASIHQLYQSEDQRPLWYQLAYGLLILSFVAIVSTLPSLPQGGVLYLVLGTLFLGVVFYMMILGHWYLVTPKMSVRPLQVSMMLVWFFLLTKILLSLYGLSQTTAFFERFTTQGEGFSFNWLMVICRFGVGHLALLVSSLFAWKLIGMRDTQGATGIFYVMVIFLFIGELFGAYYFFKHGILV